MQPGRIRRARRGIALAGACMALALTAGGRASGDAAPAGVRARTLTGLDRADCAESLDDWLVVRGSLRPAGRCGAYIGFTDAGSGTFSYGDFLYRRPQRAPLDLAVTWRRLGPETGRALELRALGVLVLLRDGEYGLYTWNESTFAWRSLPWYREHDAHRIAVHQTTTRLDLSIDGRAIDSWPVVATGQGQVGVAAKGATTYRSAFELRDFRATSQ